MQPLPSSSLASAAGFQLLGHSVGAFVSLPLAALLTLYGTPNPWPLIMCKALGVVAL